jgi:hypothetical protein
VGEILAPGRQVWCQTQEEEEEEVMVGLVVEGVEMMMMTGEKKKKPSCRPSRAIDSNSRATLFVVPP